VKATHEKLKGVKCLNKLRLLKAAIPLLFLVFAVLLALALMFESEVLTVAGLLVFTAAASLMTYYMVLTQS
jgi:hypothetical protein